MAKRSVYRSFRKVHKWAGLIGCLWIFVLGLTGLFLDHRDDWGWAWRVNVPDSILPASTVDRLAIRHITLAQANTENPSEWVVGGSAGVWAKNLADDWHIVPFEGRSVPPIVYEILQDDILGWRQLWLATDDGLWSVKTDTKPWRAERVALEGEALTALDVQAATGTFVGILDRTVLATWRAGDPVNIVRTVLDETIVVGLPEKVSWSRFLFDLHLGRAIFDRPLSQLINDYGALAFMFLSVTGFLHWYLPRRWRGDRGPSGTRKRIFFRWLYRFHAPLFGIAALIPIFYLSATGIVMDHRFEIMGTLVRNKIDRDNLPPVYDFTSLENEISHVVAYPDNDDRYTVGTRLGVLTTEDGGAHWTRETGVPFSPGFVWNLDRIDDELFLGGLGGPSFYRPVGGGPWRMLEGLMGMPSDGTRIEDDWYVISGLNMFIGSPKEGFRVEKFQLPVFDHKPLMLLMFEIHNGDIIHQNFRYVLDIFAVIGIVMVFTGPVLWWRRRWG